MTPNFRIEQLTPQQAQDALPGLIALLQDAVESAASIGFLPPLPDEEAAAYWRDVAAAVHRGFHLLFVARQGDHIVGSVQLALATKPNARHRAEVQKLLVLRRARRQGIGRALMLALEEAARPAGRTLLVLDTRQGDPSEALYRGLGYTCAGAIPHYARNEKGGLDATALYYKFLE